MSLLAVRYVTKMFLLTFSAVTVSGVHQGVQKNTINSSTVLCSVDLSNEVGLYLDIVKVRPGSKCELKMNSVTQERITVSSQTSAHLSFLDCASTDLQITARMSIECLTFSDCPMGPVPLTVPVLPTCLPSLLSNMTWSLHPPPGGTVELLSPSGNFMQSLPEQLCNGSIILTVAEGSGTVGQFCQQGPIEKIMIHTQMNVTATSTGNKGLHTSFLALNVSFEKNISETYIVYVSLKKYATTRLATPNWPAGMRSDSTISWIVNVPPETEAHVTFTILDEPTCDNRHTYILVQCLGIEEPVYYFREDEKPKTELKVAGSFYLNMSNCRPQEGQFSVITTITLDKNNSLLLTYILSALACLVVAVIVLAVACIVIKRRKKKQMNHEVSNVTRPGNSSLTKSHHEYATIDDSLVYSHLLNRETEMGVPRCVDMYQPFTGPTEPQGPPLSSDVAPLEVDEYFVPLSLQPPPVPSRPPSHCQTMVDNDLYQAMVYDGMEHSRGLDENTVATTENSHQ